MLRSCIQLFRESDAQLRELERSARATRDPELWRKLRHAQVRVGAREHPLTQHARLWLKTQSLAYRPGQSPYLATATKRDKRDTLRLYQAGRHERRFWDRVNEHYPEPQDTGDTKANSTARSSWLTGVLQHIQPSAGVSRKVHLDAVAGATRRAAGGHGASVAGADRGSDLWQWSSARPNQPRVRFFLNGPGVDHSGALASALKQHYPSATVKRVAARPHYHEVRVDFNDESQHGA